MCEVIKFKLNEIIKKKRLDETRGKSNRQLAKEIGISHVALYKMRKGLPYNPSLEMLDRLCCFFKCRIGDVLEYRRR